jgi:DNA-binding NarL/FixJ family response regulator
MVKVPFAGVEEQAQPPLGHALSARESQVIRMIAWGHTNKQIAARLDVSVKTVEAHKANAMRKLGFTDRTEVVRYALAQGWLGMDGTGEPR